MNAQLNTASLTKVGTVTERGGYDMGLPGQPAGFKQAAGLDSEAVDKTGIDLGATGRLALMAKLAQGTGMELPQQAASALSQAQAAQAYSHPTQPQNAADHHRQAAEMLAEQQQVKKDYIVFVTFHDLVQRANLGPESAIDKICLAQHLVRQVI